MASASSTREVSLRKELRRKWAADSPGRVPGPHAEGVEEAGTVSESVVWPEYGRGIRPKAYLQFGLGQTAPLQYDFGHCSCPG